MANSKDGFTLSASIVNEAATYFGILEARKRLGRLRRVSVLPKSTRRVVWVHVVGNVA